MYAAWDRQHDWPLWPDVDRGVRDLARRHRVGLLSKLEDAPLARTRLAALPLAPDLVITSAVCSLSSGGRRRTAKVLWAGCSGEPTMRIVPAAGCSVATIIPVSGQART